MTYRYHIVWMLMLPMIALLSSCADSFLPENILPSGEETEDANIIRIGGIENSGLEVSLGQSVARATNSTPVVDAETIDWMLGPLFGGLDITYGLVGKEDETKKVAILKLEKKDPSGGDIQANIKYSDYTGTNGEKIAEYSFRYLSDNKDAIWYGNGKHFFQGVYVPGELRYVPANSENLATVNGSGGKAPALREDQGKDQIVDGKIPNYTLLERYLGMPANATISATVGRIKLPFRHRLSHIIAYVLIDPAMGSGVTIKGYKKSSTGTPMTSEDPSTSSIRFCNVKVLSGVEQVDDAGGHSKLTPRWDVARKVIPHYVDELGSVNSTGEVKDGEHFIMFYNKEEKVYIFPADDDAWITAWNKWNEKYKAAINAGKEEAVAIKSADDNSGYERTLYAKVPVYDMIVRPTYSSESTVMYDEDLTGTTARAFASQDNKIDFEITLDNGLQYEKEFKFDLDANHETIVYLRISRESIDYNNSGSDTWEEDQRADGYYGVNNSNGNTLSKAGSSWQRAYRIGNRNPDITDGHYYGKDDDTTDSDNAMPDYAQYVDQTKWVEMFAQAYSGGLHHGDYFILDQNITIDATKLPDNFVFTGHLDAQDHTITFTNGGTQWTEYSATTDYSISPLYTSPSGGEKFALPQLYTKVHHDANFQDESELYQIEGVWYLKSTLTYVPAVAEVYHSATQEDVDNGKAQNVGDKVVDTPAQPERYEKKIDSVPRQDAYDEYPVASPSLSDVMSGSVTYYKKIAEDNYQPYSLADVTFYKAVSHTSGTTLFAGLNGAYDASVGEANVHLERGVYVPYVDSTTGTGWRAEIINARISGTTFFLSSVFHEDGSYKVSEVSGYVYNCWEVSNEGSKKLKGHTPALPKY